jgi:hypothetical protein
MISIGSSSAKKEKYVALKTKVWNLKNKDSSLQHEVRKN